jgi:putative tryptophan/tyrosine transport system substrate-binding protein
MTPKFFWLITAIVLALFHPAQAQQPKKIPRVGYLLTGDASSESNRFEAIRLALRDLGYTEGQTITTEYRYAEGNRDLFHDRAAELVRLGVDIFVVFGGAGLIQAAKDATKTIPIVMAGQGLDPVKAGLVQSLARPGGNVTGITNVTRELGGKRLELLKEAVPKITRAAILYEQIRLV